MLLVLDADNRVLAASRAARRGLDGIEEGRPVPEELLGGEGRHEPVRVPYEVEGRSEALLYLSPPGELAAYEELRAGLHGRRLARAPDAAGAPARPAGDGVASGAGHGRLSSSSRGRRSSTSAS